MSAWMYFAIGTGLLVALGVMALGILQAGAAVDRSMGYSDDEVEP